MLSQKKNRTVATLLAFCGTVIPIAGWHKFYLGQPLWGAVYVCLSWTPIPHIASAIEAVWYLAQDTDNFQRHFQGAGILGIQETPKIGSNEAIAYSIRQLEQLRQDGLISEYEFEQKRRQYLDRMA
jgi:TM2 domain-containing membrane protein YozV